MIRQPAVAGQFYPGTAAPLRAMIKKFVEAKAAKTRAIGVVAPHAGYPYSGPVAAAVFSRIALPETCIILGPNHTGRGKPLSIMTEGTWQTPLGQVEIDRELAGQIMAASSHLAEDSVAHLYEHSIEVQLPFLQYFRPDVRLVPIIMAYAGGAVYKEVGQELARAIRAANREVLIVASSDMTHYEPQETARHKDQQAIEAILELNEDELLARVEQLDISMCGFAPVTALIAAAKALGAKEAELVRYQTSGDTAGDYRSVVGYAGIIIKAPAAAPPLVNLARRTVEAYVNHGKVPPPGELSPEMKEQAGVFVSIHKGGDLRGCIGTFEPHRPNVAQEVITNAISSATRDPRFPPVAPEELAELSYSVDVLTAPEPVAGPEQLDPRKYGVIVAAGPRRGLLLPDLEGVDTVEQQIDICRRKAGIMPDEPVKLYRFQVKRYQ